MSAVAKGLEPVDPKEGGAPTTVSLALLRRLREQRAAETTHDFDALTLAVGRDQDRQAFATLFDHFGPRIKTWLMHSGSAAVAADDIVQDTFVVLWRKASQFDPSRAPVSAWLFTIARNLRAESYRGLSRTWLTLDDGMVDEVPDTAAPTADARIFARERTEGVRRALSRLTVEQRQLLQLNFYENQSHSAIASELKMPLGTVKTKIRRAATRLRELLEEYR